MASDYYVVPVIPEELSTFGLRLIQRRIGELKELYPDDVKIEFAGAVLNRVDIRRKDHIRIAEKIMADNSYKCFDNWIGDVKPLYVVTDFKFRGEEGGLPYYERPYQKYGGSKRCKNPTRSDLLYRKGDGITPDYIRIYSRIRGFVWELMNRTR
ncbi:MAG: hypothetical protein AB1523_11950 [Bacillota bacterium]